MNDLIRNERTKLTASWLSSIAAGVIVTGVVAPAVAVLYGVSGATQAGNFAIAFGSLVWLSAGTALHFLARATLRRLET